jgi:GDP-L-fucose synthase
VVQAIDRNSRVYVAGHRGLAGSAIWRALAAEGFADLVGARSSEVDLRDRAQAFDYLMSVRPDVVVPAAARVGGIVANNTFPAEFLSDNLRIQVNVMDAAHGADVQRLLFLGSSCIYPKYAEQPIKESSLLTGALEPTNGAYAIAKIAGIMQVQAHRRQYGEQWISVMPTNLYGPGDNFDPENSHVMPALIRRFHEAVESGADQVVLWGSGTPRREFLHVDDLGRRSCDCSTSTTTPSTSTSASGTTCRSGSWPRRSRTSWGSPERLCRTRRGRTGPNASCSTSRASGRWVGSRTSGCRRGSRAPIAG